MVDRANLYVDKNSDFQAPLSFFDDDGPIDMSLYSFYAQIRKIYSTAIVADFKFHLVDLVAGEVEFYLTSDDTKNLKPGKYQYDVLIQDNNGEVIKVLEGFVFINETVTEING